jgi:hypothetical protein
MSRNESAVSAPLVSVSPVRARTPSGFGTLGRRGDSWMGGTANITDPTTMIAATNTTRLAHRQRGPGISRPFGKKRTRKSSRIPPSPVVMLNTQAAHATQPRGDAPARMPRTATNPEKRSIESATAIPSSNQPMGFRGRRAAISTPRIPAMGAPMKYGICAVTGESIAVQSRVSRTRAVSVRTRQKSPIPRASHRARCSHLVVMPRTIRRAHRAVDGAAPPCEKGGSPPRCAYGGSCSSRRAGWGRLSPQELQANEDRRLYGPRSAHCGRTVLAI